MPGQHGTQNVVVLADLKLDGIKPRFTGVSKPALDDMCNHRGSCVGHHERVESYAVSPVGDDHCGFWMPGGIEPEELTESVGWARGTPPPLQVGGLIQSDCGVSAADSLEQRGHSCQVVDADPKFFSQLLHCPNLLARLGLTDRILASGEWGTVLA